MYFHDGERRIDLVLTYLNPAAQDEPSPAKQGASNDKSNVKLIKQISEAVENLFDQNDLEQKERMQNRTAFEKNLEAVGLELELEPCEVESIMLYAMSKYNCYF